MSSEPKHQRAVVKLAKTAHKFCAAALLAYGTVKVGWWTLRTIGKLVGVGKGSSQPRPAAQQPVDVDSGGPAQDKWVVSGAEPPVCPPNFKQIASAELPCSVEDFYALVVSSRSDFFQQHSRNEGQWDFTASNWRSEQLPEPIPAQLQHMPPAGAFSRTLTFVQPKKPPSSVDSQCVQRQRFAVYQGNVLIFTTSQNMLNIPFKDCFFVNTWWEVRPVGVSACNVTIHLRVQFVKTCLVGGIISRTTFRDCSQTYAKFLLSASALVASAPRGTPRGMSSSLQSVSRRQPAARGAAHDTSAWIGGSGHKGQELAQVGSVAVVVVMVVVLSFWQLMVLKNLRLTDLKSMAWR